MADTIEENGKSRWSAEGLKQAVTVFIGISPYMVMLMIWGSTINERVRVVEVRVDHIESLERKREADAMEQRRELLVRMDRIGVQIEVLQQLVASRSAGIVIRPAGEDPPIKYRNSGSIR